MEEVRLGPYLICCSQISSSLSVINGQVDLARPAEGIGRRVGCNSLQTAVALARLQQRAVFRERLLQEDHALQRGLDACLPQLVDASLDRRVHSEHAN